MRLIALFLLLLLPPSYAGQVFSSLEALENKNTTLISNALGSDEKIIETVTAIGYGTSVDSAAKNAAENALTKVVGSFIDSETLIKKKKEIQDGVISRTKVIKKDIRNYSQGSIKYFEILNIQQNGSIFSITARVDVRIDDFRAYIKQLALGTKEISTTNLFAEMDSKTKNLDNKYELLKKIILPLQEGKVFDIEIGNLRTLNSFVSSEECLKFFDKEVCDSKDDWFVSFNNEKSVIFPFSIKLKNDYLENILNILNNISDKKKESYEKAWRPYIYQFDKREGYTFSKSNDFGVVIHEYNLGNNDKTTYFILEDIRERTQDNQELFKNKNNLGIKISLLDKNDQIIYSFREKCKDYSNDVNYLRTDGSLNNLLFSTQRNLGDRGFLAERGGTKCFSHMTFFYYQLNKSREMVDIQSQKDFWFIFEVDDLELLQNFKKLQINYIKD